MRVLLVGPDLESNLSLRYLASSLRSAGHVPEIATFDSAEDTAGVVRRAEGAGLVGLSMCFQVRASEFLTLARALKAAEPQRPVIAGGHFASCAAAELLAHHPELDLVVIHDGEQAIVELANLGPRLLTGAAGLKGVAVRIDGRPTLTSARRALADLDQLPVPDRSGPARLIAGVPTAYLMGSRGCVKSCDYCCITTLHRLAPGRRFRQRAPEKVADEVAALYHQRGVRQFVFHDDNFLVPSYAHNAARVECLDAALGSRGVRDIGLVLKCSPGDADRRILTRLKQMGLLRIYMGIESGTQCGLDAIGRRQTVAEATRALELCEELDLSSQYTLIIFHPEATPESMLADLDFARRHPEHPLNYCRAEVYAGTPLERRLLANGRAVGSFMGRVYRYTDPRVERIWELGRDLFAGRCWGQDEILGHAIRLDHQIAVVRHFYEGAAVERLVRSFREVQTELNLETADLFRDLVLTCAGAPGSRLSPSGRVLAELTGRERKGRQLLRVRLCELRSAVDRCTRAALPPALRPKSPPERKHRLHLAVPRHAAAVAVALGLAGCLRGTQTAEQCGSHDAGVDAGVERPVLDEGISEAAPPPMLEYGVVQRVIGRGHAALSKCFLEHEADLPSIEGQVMVTFTIDDLGQVTEASTDMKNKPVGKCLEAQVKKLRFPSKRYTRTKLTLPLGYKKEK